MGKRQSGLLIFWDMSFGMSTRDLPRSIVQSELFAESETSEYRIDVLELAHGVEER